MEKFIGSWRKFLTESSLSRLYQHMVEHESAILSAFRNEYSKKETILITDAGSNYYIGGQVWKFKNKQTESIGFFKLVIQKQSFL